MNRDEDYPKRKTDALFCSKHGLWFSDTRGSFLCLACENDKLKIENDDLKKAIKILQQ